MEKQTIGRFIAALRKANGMTQQHLADKLSVSNKTVSKWECDDGYPDLCLIPVIAELFGVTSDEILKGARIKPAAVDDVETLNDMANLPAPQPQKSEKQFNYLLQKELNRFKYLSMIAVGLTALSFIFLWPFEYHVVFVFIFSASAVFLQYFLMNFAKNALHNPDLSEEADARIMRAVKSIETRSFHIFTANAVILINNVALVFWFSLPEIFLFCLPSACAIYCAAFVIKALTADTKYYTNAAQSALKAELKKLNANSVFLGISVLAAAIMIQVSLYIITESMNSVNMAAFFGVYFTIISLACLIYWFKRRAALEGIKKAASGKWKLVSFGMIALMMIHLAAFEIVWMFAPESRRGFEFFTFLNYLAFFVIISGLTTAYFFSKNRLANHILITVKLLISLFMLLWMWLVMLLAFHNPSDFEYASMGLSGIIMGVFVLLLFVFEVYILGRIKDNAQRTAHNDG